MIKYFLLTCVLLLISSTARAAALQSGSFIAAVQKAIDTNDSEAFFELVDIDAMITHAARAFLKHTDKSALAELAEQPLPPAMRALLAGARSSYLQGPLIALLIKEGRQAIRYGIDSGLFSGQVATGVRPAGMLAPYMDKLTPGRKTLQERGAVREDGKRRIIPVNYHDAASGDSFNLDLVVAPAEDGWKAVEIANVHELLRASGR